MTDTQPVLTVPCLRCGDFCEAEAAALTLGFCPSCFSNTGWGPQDLPLQPVTDLSTKALWFSVMFSINEALSWLIIPALFPSTPTFDLILLTFLSSWILAGLPFLFLSRFDILGHDRFKRRLVKLSGLVDNPHFQPELVYCFDFWPRFWYAFPAKHSALLTRTARGLVLVTERAHTMTLDLDQIRKVEVRRTWFLPPRRFICVEYQDSKSQTNGGLLKFMVLVLVDEQHHQQQNQVVPEFAQWLQSQIPNEQTG